MDKINNDLNCTLDINPEVGQRWFPIAIQVGYEVAFDGAHAYVGAYGRQKYILPVYTALCRNGYRSLALKWYKEYESFYHPIAAANIRKIILSTLARDDFDTFELNSSVRSIDK